MRISDQPTRNRTATAGSGMNKAGVGVVLAAMLLCWPMLAQASVPGRMLANVFQAETAADRSPSQPAAHWTFPPIPKPSPLAVPVCRPRTDAQELLLGGLLALPAFFLLGLARRLVTRPPRVVRPRQTYCVV